MRIAVLSGLALLLCAPPPCLAQDRRAVLRRDSGGQPAAGPLATSSVAMPTTGHPSSTATTTTSRAPSPSDNSTASLLTPSAAPSGSLLYSNSTNSTEPGQLPLSPQLSPATVLTGVMLILSGLAYGFFSLRYTLMHNFFSVAYFGALAVTCLIVFVEEPGASPGRAAGYVCAALATGVLMGGLASPFAAITESAGCFLTGFCVSMWFLSLVDGGLIKSRAGKTVFITAMSGAFGAFGLVRFTRHRLLIFGIPFCAATAIVLGIDCFTLAGLKEFWIYIWGFNMDLFPLYTNTYPVTRPIRVESSCTIVIFLFSLVVNLKLWKLLRQQKRREHEERIRKQGEVEAAEAEAGIRTEFGVAREKQLWEATYSDSGRNSVISFEKRLGTPKSDRPRSAGTLDLMEVDVNDAAAVSRRRSKRISQGAGITITLEQIAEDGAGECESMNEHNQSAGHSSRSSSVPPVIPLPASLVADDNADAKTPGSSASTPADARRASSGPGSVALGSDDEKPDESVTEDDRSSLAANLDELEKNSIATSSRPTTPGSPITSTPQKPDPTTDSQPNRASLALSVGASDADAPTVARQKSASSLRSGAEKQDEISADSKSVGDGTLTMGNIKGQLPTRVLKAIKQQKTFEWAKQSTLADTPPLEEIPRPSSPGISYEMNAENPAVTKGVPKDMDGADRQGSSTTTPASASSTSVNSLNPPVRSSPLPVNPPNPTPARRVSWNQTTSPPLSPSTANAKDPLEDRPVSRGRPPPPAKADTLLGRRESNLAKRMSTVSFTGMPISAFSRSTPNLAGGGAVNGTVEHRRSSRPPTATAAAEVVAAAEREREVKRRSRRREQREQESSDEDVPLAVRRSQLLRDRSMRRESDLPTATPQQRPRTSAAAAPFHGGHHGNQPQQRSHRNPPSRPVSAHFPSQQHRHVSDSAYQLQLLQRQDTWRSTSTDALLLAGNQRRGELSSSSGNGVGTGAVLAADARAVANRLYSGAAGAAPGAAEERAARLASWRRSLRREEAAKRAAGPLGSTAAAAAVKSSTTNAAAAYAMGGGAAAGFAMAGGGHHGALGDPRQQQREAAMAQQLARPRTSGVDGVARHVRSLRDMQAQVRLD